MSRTRRYRIAHVRIPRREPAFTGARILRLATLLALSLASGCALLGPKGEPPAIFALDPRVEPAGEWPNVTWQLTLAPASAARMIDSRRMLVRPSGQEMQVYKDATWAKRPPEMVEDALLRTLEDSGRIPAVARQGSGVAADYKLVLDVRRFESVYVGATPEATVEVHAKLLHATDQKVVASRTFLRQIPAAGTATPAVAGAFEQALQAVTRDLAGWVLTTGAAHESNGHPDP